MTLRPLHLRLLLPVVVLAALTTACGSEPTAAPPGAAPSPAAPSPAGPSPAGPSPAASSGPASPSPAAPAAPTAAAPASAATLTIQDFEYDVPSTVAAGAEVRVVNQDGEAHTVTLKGTDVAVVVQGGATVVLTAPAKAGTYQIGCDFHGSMSAELVVT